MISPKLIATHPQRTYTQTLQIWLKEIDALKGNEYKIANWSKKFFKLAYDILKKDKQAFFSDLSLMVGSKLIKELPPIYYWTQGLQIGRHVMTAALNPRAHLLSYGPTLIYSLFVKNSQPKTPADAQAHNQAARLLFLMGYISGTLLDAKAKITRSASKL